MIEFYTFSWLVRIFITFILGICVLMQTLALVLNFYRYSLTKPRIFENLLELSILCQILIFSLLHGQVINGYEKGFVVPSGYENIRIITFIVISIFVIAVYIFTRNMMYFMILPVVAVSLPLIENVTGNAFPWLFVSSLIFLLGRSIKICVSSITSISTSISAWSVKNAVDTLHTGVLFCESDGFTVLSNHQMQNLMLAITGKVFRNSIEFYDMLISDKYKTKYEKAELDGQTVYLLPDGAAWMFTKTDIQFKMKKYIHISVADVSEHWSLTAKLQLKNQELNYKSDELKKTIANLQVLSKEREIENARMRAHDILGQRLTVLLNTMQNKRDIDYDLLTSLSKGLLEELKAEHTKTGPYDELKNIRKVFSAIGVDIKFEGQLPKNEQLASLFVDIIREGSTNAVRHGFATQINIKSKLLDNAYNLTVTNNGHTTSAPINVGSGIGLMRKKVDGQGGNLDIINQPIFTLSVAIPGGDKYV